MNERHKFVRGGLATLMLAGQFVAAEGPRADLLSAALRTPDNGATTWTIVMTTGHLGADPLMGDATRKYIFDLLSSRLASQDKVRIVAAEMDIWDSKILSDPTRLLEELPQTPALSSKGGRDIEKVMTKLIAESKGPVLIFAPGASQLPMDGVGKLQGGLVQSFVGEVRMHRETLLVGNKERALNVTYWVPPDSFVGEEPRTPVAFGNAVVTNVPRRPQVAEDSSSTAGQGVPPYIFVIGAALAGVVGGFLGSRWTGNRSQGPSDVAVSAPTSTSDSDASKALIKRLDLISQDISEAWANLQDEKANLSTDANMAGEQLQASLDSWDHTAMKFLTTTHHLSRSAEVPDVERPIWTNVFESFTTIVARHGLDVIFPSVGDEPTPGYCEVVSATPDSGLAMGLITAVHSPGLRRGTDVIRAAKIDVAR